MTREEILKSDLLKKEFCESCNLPIDIYQEPYFSERLETINDYENSLMLFDIFCDEFKKYSSLSEYLKYKNDIIEKIIKHIKNKKEYLDFNKTILKFKDTQIDNTLYDDKNDQKYFISIKFKDGLFSVLKNCFAEYTLDDWESFVLKFTDNKFLAKDKIFKDTILNKLNPKKQTEYGRYLINFLYNYLRNIFPQISSMIFSLNEKELLLKIPNSDITFSLSELENTIKLSPYNVGNLVYMEYFMIQKFKYGWIKVSKNKIEFNNVDKKIYNQVIKIWSNQEITDNDLVFIYEGKLAKFLKKIEDSYIFWI